MRFKNLLIIAFTLLLVYSFTLKNMQKPQLGISAGLDRDSLVYASGFRMLGESVRKMLAPSLTGEQFEQNLSLIKAAKCKVMMCNLFFPGTLKIAGPDVDEKKVLAYADSVLNRAGQAGVKIIVLGSGGSRNIPEGYDLQKAETSFVNLAKKLGAIAKKYNVTIVLENLETTETNFITSLKSAASIVKRVNDPNFRLNADIFHMMREGELPNEIVAAGKLLAFCEIAEKEKRTLPGVMGDDFKPYLSALKKANYSGYIFIEGNIGNAEVEIPKAFNYLTKQIDEVY
ncbi:sugar phosphate isomerase/epimerase [Pedobacter jejuensis]|uniref:Sugar phosphate isomerase/epimerase n=2 Tax=Pedobacter jejuensis TaxID=1268550 RepID=A0A3N0C3A7_9SPHI|nr:sugar phosphate isomerase/epimerase [Pedobacter jejuensis]